MKRLMALILTLVMLISSALFVIPASASNYLEDGNTLSYRGGGGVGLSVSGNTVKFNLSKVIDNQPAYWSNAQMIVNDDVKDGFTVKISDIVWDDANDNAVAVVYGDMTSVNPVLVSENDSCFVLLARKDGSIALWGNGYNTNHVLGKWTHACVTVQNVLPAKATEFTYKLVPNNDKSVFTFYVNDTAIFSYDIAWFAANKSSHTRSIFSKLDTPCNFGFMVLNGTGSYDTGWTTKPVGTLSYTVNKVESEGSLDYYPINSDTLTFAAGGGQGVSLSGNKLNFNLTTASSSAPAYWSRAQMTSVDDIKDGFAVKISDIVWDEANNNAVAITYGNGSSMGCTSVSATDSKFVLLVKKDGSVSLWGNGYNTNHVLGKWTHACVTVQNVLPANATEFVYKLIPNEDLSVFTFYVNDVEIYSYDIEVMTAKSSHKYSIFSRLDTLNGFGFQVLNGTGSYDTGWVTLPVGTLSYTIEQIKKAGFLNDTGADVDCDGTVTNKDVTIIIRYLCGWNVSYNIPDVTGDGKINNRDAIYIIQILNGFDVGGNTPGEDDEKQLYVPNSLTLSMYDTSDTLSYGITWNNSERPVNPTVQIRKASETEYTEYPATVTGYSSYDVDKNGIYVYVCKAVVELEPDTEYCYRIVDKGADKLEMDEISFTSVDPAKESFTFAAFSDSQNTSHSGANFNKVLGSISDVDFYLHGGDICEDTSAEQYWTNMLDYNKDYLATTPIMVAAGNHDTTYYKAGNDEIAKHFNYNIPEQSTVYGCYYSFDYGNARFIVLNTNDLTSGKLKEDQYNWLVEQLEGNDKEWLIINMHNPIYSIGKWGSDPSYNATALALKDQLVPLFAEYGVDLVIQAHDHNVTRTYPIDADGNPLTEESQAIDDINYTVSPEGTVYVMNGHCGGSTGVVVDYDESLFANAVAGTRLSWAEITVEQGKLTLHSKYISSDGVSVKTRYSWGIVK